ncbi:MAG: M48 family metallopeptidase [Gammaproteobacteria bacterium]|nr:M48 family metallopeptidase [Gammaproteobacteria bacterium]
MKFNSTLKFHNPAFKIAAIAFVLLSLFLSACSTSPTGRKQILLFPESQMAQMGAAAYQETKKGTPISKNSKSNAYISCIADAIVAKVEPDKAWEVTVFDSEQVNAFALPGGKIGIYTGLLSVAKNQHQLATVIGHEIAHVTARHGNARVSASTLTQVGLAAAQILAGSASREKQQLLGLLGLGAQVGILLPYGRGQESESDILGLVYMASAGFDPRQSVPLWQNMAKASGGKAPPELLSTHPSNATRIADLNKAMPDAMIIYNKARSQGEKPNCKQ